VRDAIRDLTPFATLRKVRIEFDELGLVYIEAKRGAVGRAIVNVLHNAIKYSWQRENDRTAIQVAVRADHQFAIVSVENWGVPIPKDEIETGLVFELGYRGRLASDGGRVGTGVGLSDSLRVAHDHDGSLEIQSKPAQAQQSQTDYHQPFVTIVSLRLALRPHVAAEEW
jgi:signal transduction histidine kinase